MTQPDKNLQQDIDNILQIPIISTILDVICLNTGMGFSAVARVTEEKWITCSARDDIGFGLKPGDELELKTTICDEIRDSYKEVVIDNVPAHPIFKDHHTPKTYGFKSYISFPIFKKDGTFFGTLCAIDPSPNMLDNPAVRGMFSLFTDLISFHLEAVEFVGLANKKLEIEKSVALELKRKAGDDAITIQKSNAQLKKMEKELQTFSYISSHDLQEPLRKIQSISSILLEKEADKLSESGKDWFKRLQEAANRMQLLIDDLLTYSTTATSKNVLEKVLLSEILEQTTADLKEVIELRDINLATDFSDDAATVIPSQLRLLFYNLISNSVKFSDETLPLKIIISSRRDTGKSLHDSLLSDTIYHHINITDNGHGFDQKFSSRIFELFQRLSDKPQHGTGMGLALVKKIVENHNGHISANGQLGKGASFDIYIPVHV